MGPGSANKHPRNWEGSSENWDVLCRRGHVLPGGHNDPDGDKLFIRGRASRHSFYPGKSGRGLGKCHRLDKEGSGSADRTRLSSRNRPLRGTSSRDRCLRQRREVLLAGQVLSTGKALQTGKASVDRKRHPRQGPQTSSADRAGQHVLGSSCHPSQPH